MRRQDTARKAAWWSSASLSPAVLRAPAGRASPVASVGAPRKKLKIGPH